MARSKALLVQVGKHTLELTNLDKVFYPETGFTKGEVIDYYARVAPALLPHVRNRPLTLKRYPDGVTGEFFYQKQAPANHPAWLPTCTVWSEGRDAEIEYCMANDVEGLLWLVNAADLEMHAFLCTCDDVARPTAIAFDLDPGQPADVVACCDVALDLRDRLRSLRLQAYPKTSGGKGMQVYVPLNTPTTYGATKPFAHEMAKDLEAGQPKRVTSLMRKSLRHGKVFVDWSQNDEHKTTVCAYSLRARPRPTASTPLTWKEVEDAAASRKATTIVFEAGQVLARIREHGDLFGPVLQKRQRLPNAS